jgi:hypothetical protein
MQKNFRPYNIKPYLDPPKQSRAGAWIFQLEFKKDFWGSQAYRKQDIPSHFLYPKTLKIDGCFCTQMTNLGRS